MAVSALQEQFSQVIHKSLPVSSIDGSSFQTHYYSDTETLTHSHATKSQKAIRFRYGIHVTAFNLKGLSARLYGSRLRCNG